MVASGQVKEGRYSNASDVMRAALRLLEEREAKLTALRAALIEGEERCPSTPFDFACSIQSLVIGAHEGQPAAVEVRHCTGCAVDS
jgi:putative addiction module CopG family antidote